MNYNICTCHTGSTCQIHNFITIVDNTDYLSVNHNSELKVSYENNWDEAHLTKGTCSKCNKPDSDIITTYSGSKITRKICKPCQVKILDKLYGLDLDSETEELLFKK